MFFSFFWALMVLSRSFLELFYKGFFGCVLGMLVFSCSPFPGSDENFPGFFQVTLKRAVKENQKRQTSTQNTQIKSTNPKAKKKRCRQSYRGGVSSSSKEFQLQPTFDQA